jgi:hypothetical protein
MAHSKLIAGFIGPLLVALGCAMLVNREIFPVIIDQISHDYGLIVLSGMLTLLAGIAIVRVHNVWSGGWQIIVTLFGWAAVVGGLARMWMPQLAGPIANTFTASQPGSADCASRCIARTGRLPFLQGLRAGLVRQS